MELLTTDLHETDNVRKPSVGALVIPVDDLLPSIAENGMKVPICVYLKRGKWYIKDGHRRLQAAKALGWEKVPCVETDPPANDSEAVAEQIVINTTRKGLSYLDMASAYQSLKDLGWSQADISRRFGVSPADVSLALAALRAHPKVQQALSEGRLAPSAAEPLLPLAMDDQERLIDAAVSAKTARKVRDLVMADRKSNSGTAKAKVSDVDADPLELMVVETLEEAVKNLKAVQGMDVVSPSMRRRGRATVQQLRNLAASMEDALSN